MRDVGRKLYNKLKYMDSELFPPVTKGMFRKNYSPYFCSREHVIKWEKKY